MTVISTCVHLTATIQKVIIGSANYVKLAIKQNQFLLKNLDIFETISRKTYQGYGNKIRYLERAWTDACPNVLVFFLAYLIPEISRLEFFFVYFLKEIPYKTHSKIFFQNPKTLGQA